jgi:hypothetical protein
MSVFLPSRLGLFHVQGLDYKPNLADCWFLPNNYQGPRIGHRGDLDLDPKLFHRFGNRFWGGVSKVEAGHPWYLWPRLARLEIHQGNQVGDNLNIFWRAANQESSRAFVRGETHSEKSWTTAGETQATKTKSCATQATEACASQATKSCASQATEAGSYRVPRFGDTKTRRQTRHCSWWQEQFPGHLG